MSRVDISVNGIALTVEFTYYKARRGERDSFMGRAGAGPQISPDEPAEVSIESIITPENIYDFLSEKQISEIEEKIFESMERDEDDFEQDEDDFEYEWGEEKG